MAVRGTAAQEGDSGLRATAAGPYKRTCMGRVTLGLAKVGSSTIAGRDGEQERQQCSPSARGHRGSVQRQVGAGGLGPCGAAQEPW